jgi:Family of unknown function (DUF6152)
MTITTVFRELCQKVEVDALRNIRDSGPASGLDRARQVAYRYPISGRILIRRDVMKKIRSLLVAGGMLLGAGLPVLAHHALALEFKTGQIITLTGMVTKIDWSNPHARGNEVGL